MDRSRRPLPRLARPAAAFVLAGLILAACVQATPYQPAQGQGRGYAEQKIAEGRYRVTFSGNSSTPRAVVEDYLVFRAAELAQGNGASHFMFATQATEPTTTYRSSFVHYPRFAYWHTWPWGYEPFGPSFATADARPITRYTASADVVLLSAAEAAREPQSFDAASVIATLGPRILRPQPR